MAADVAVKPTSMNPCCSKWREKYLKLEEKRNALRQAVKLLQQQIEKTETECLNLKKGYEEERARADSEREANEKESAARFSLENEISALRSEISTLQLKGSSDAQAKHDEGLLLRVRVSEGEKEIGRLKELLEKEKTRADSETKRAEAEKKKAAEAWMHVKAEKGKADEERKLVSIEGQKAKEYGLELEALKKEVGEAKSKLESETLKFKKEMKQLEGEKLKVKKERNRADSAMQKAEDQGKLAELNRKMAEEEKSRADDFSMQLDEAKQRIQVLQEMHEFLPSKDMDESPHDQPDKTTSFELDKVKLLWLEMLNRNVGESKLVLESLKSEKAIKRFEAEKQKAAYEQRRAHSEMVKAEEQRKLAEVNKKRAMEEKCRADELSRQFKGAQLKIEQLEKQIHELLSSRKMLKASVVTSDKDVNADSARIKLLRKQLKLEKMQVKHAKEVAKLEKDRRTILQQELGHLKLELVKFLHRLDVLDRCSSPSAEVVDDLKKNENVASMPSLKLKEKQHGLKPLKLNHQCCPNELLRPTCTAVDASNDFKQTFQHAVPLLLLNGGNCSGYTSGIDSKLQSLLQGSDQNILQSYAINSSTAFSDGQLVGSQERGSFSVTTPLKLVEEKLNVQPTISTISGEVTKLRCNENLAVVAENSVGSPLKNYVQRGTGHSRKRKRMLHAIESIELLYSEGKKLHQQIEEKMSVLHSELNKQKDKHFEEAKFSSHAKHERVHKKRKKSHEKGTLQQHLCDITVPKKAERVVAEECKDNTVCGGPFSPASNLIGNATTCREGVIEAVNATDVEKVLCFGEAADGDFMRLLELDNTADEECYRAAMEMPLSPTIPEIEFQGIGTFHMDAVQSSLEDKENRVASRSSDVNIEIDSDKMKYTGSIIFHNLSEIEAGSPRGSSDKNYVVCSRINDSGSISRIYCATRACLVRCCSCNQTDWVVPEILLALKLEENLSSREKACIFFSLLLLNFSAVALCKTGKFFDTELMRCLDSFARHMRAVVSDTEAKKMFDDLCSNELLAVIEEFIIDGRVMVHSDMASETTGGCDPGINICLDGVNISLFSEAASADQLVAGSIILTSICAAIDQLGFICELSYNIFRVHQCSTSVLLTILHIFAYLGGDKYFNLSEYSLTMDVLKSMVTFLEKGNISAAAMSSLSAANNVLVEFQPCAQCPFSKNAIPLDIMISLLLDKLQNLAQSGRKYQSMVEFANSSNSVGLAHKDNTERSLSNEGLHLVQDRIPNALSCLNYCGIPATQPESVVNVMLSQFIDALSLVELLACNMEWEWTCSKIVPQLLRMLVSPMLETFAVGVVVLLGQLGRLRVNAGGREDGEVENLISKLSAFLQQVIDSRSCLAVQIATVSALLGLLSLDFASVVQSNVKLSSISSQSDSSNLIKNWFSLLTKEQQLLSYSLFQSTGVATN